MPTPLLTVDCSNLHLHLQTLSFPLLPIPLLLSPPNVSLSFDVLPRCFSSCSCSPDDLHTFPVDTALHCFLSAVLPQPFEIRNADSPIDDRCLGVGSGSQAFQDSEETDKNTIGSKHDNWSDIVEFEAPELDQFLEGACELKREIADILSKVPEFEDNSEMTHFAASDPYLHEVQRAAYLVEDVPPDVSMDLKIYTEDVDFYMRRSHFSDTMFPQLELEEITIGKFSGVSMEDELLLLLENIDTHDITGKDENEVNWEGLFTSMEIKRVSDQILSKPFLESHVAHPNFFLETDLMYIAETSCTEDKGFHYGIFDVDSDLLVEPDPFEEFKMLDPEYFEISDTISISKISNVPGKCDQSSLKGMNFKSYDELIVCHEIAMVDNNFKSFPVPVLPHDQKVLSLHANLTMLFAGVEPLPVCASDEIYLDWDLLGKDKGNRDIHATFQRMFSDVGMLRSSYDIQSAQGSGQLLDFILSDDIWNEITTENKMSMMSVEKSIVAEQLCGVSTSKMLDDDIQKAEGGEKMTIIDSKKVLLRVESEPQFNELEFFLNPKKATEVTRSDLGLGKLNGGSVISAGTCEDKKTSSSSTSIQMDKWDFQLHVVNLPANILTLIENFKKSFLAVIDDPCLKSRESTFTIMDDMLSVPEEKLMNYMRILCEEKSLSGHIDDVISAFCALLAIKRMTWCLCFCGIHALYEFINKLLQKIECLRSRLGLLFPCIEEAYTQSKKEVVKLHPALALTQEILKTNTSQRSRVLIVAEQKLWWPLKSLLTSMNMLVSVANSPMNGSFPDASDFHKASQTRSDVLQSDCLLVSHEHISAAILLKQFDIILEYGGLQSSSKVSSILTKSTCSLNLHFLKVELDGAAKALCSGLDIPLNNGFTMKLEELLNFVAVVEHCNLMTLETTGQKMACWMPLPADCIPVESMSNIPDQSFCPHTAIIVNTQNFDTEMIISRRSTYQRILSLEKGGVQILERDFCLPVDVIISASTCLAWYDCRNITKKATAPDEAASSVPLCVDNIAANVLTTLSFTFGSCIMVFEGESNFLATVTESSDELYAAAASLGIELQIFCSYSSELTEEIILNCIRYAMKFDKGLFPKLSESETIAESFLMKFPSVNPLSALAILSSGAMLLEFLGWSEDCRIHALQKYHVPVESVNLFSVLCRYGKREESVSGMTDCSSSVSSAPNSEILDCNFSFEKRKRKHNESSFDAVDNFRNQQSTRLNVDNLYNPTMSRLQKTSDQTKSAEQPLNIELFCLEKGPDGAEIMASEPHVSWVSRDPKITNDVAGATFPSKGRFLGHKKKLAAATSIKLPSHNADMFQGLSDDFMGEVLDVDDGSLFGEDFSSVTKATNFFLPKHETEEVPGIKSSRAVRRLSFELDTHPNFPTFAQIGSDSIQWSSQENDRRARQGRDSQVAHSSFEIYGVDLQKDPPAGGKTEKPATYLQRLLRKEKGQSGYEGTPLRKAIWSRELEGGSPWTKEFLNQVREKIRLHRQYLPCNTSPPCSDYGGTTSKGTKRKSPSIYEYFKYQSGKTPTKLTGRMRKKQSINHSTLSKNENNSLSCLPHSLTPVDKRARQTLSFAVSGNGGQTKLVWNDKPSQGQGNRFCG